MSLADRVKAARSTDTTVDGQRDEIKADLRRKLHYKVVEGLGPTLYNAQMSDAELKLRVMETSVAYYPRSYDEGKKHSQTNFFQIGCTL